MCGLAGAFATAKRDVVVRAVQKMTAAMAHRGPDDGGISDFGLRIADCASAMDEQQNKTSVVLGVRRLAILDVSAAGHQPMQDEEAGITIAYNGETYNYRELRAEIGNEFGPWRSNTDTEVVLRAYRKWGPQAFQRLRGMFALAIWDSSKQELILARDQFGIKPLYYYPGISNFEFQNANQKFEIRNSKSEVLFASEIRALLASDMVPRILSVDGMASYLNYGSVEAPLTIVEGVRSLMPGHYLVMRSDLGTFNFKETAYTNNRTSDLGYVASESDSPSSRREAVAVLREKLEESVRLHLVSDVPLGVFLSGGMDSSALVALMCQVTSEKPKTFSVVFDEEKFNEAPHSRLVAARFQTEHREIPLDENHFLYLLPTALGAMDQPTMDAINTFVVSKAVKDAGVTVALSGLGGDELFAGYPSFRRALRLQNMSTFSRRLLRSASGIGKATLGGSVQRSKFWALVESNGRPTDVYQTTRQLFAVPEVASLLVGRSAISGERQLAGWQLRSTRSPNGSHGLCVSDPINEISELEMKGYMANTLLRDTDSMSMAHSLEVRVPFVDNEVSRFVLGLPGQWKLNGGGPKPLLRDALKDLLPEQFLNRPKMGFTLPFEKWMRSHLLDSLSDVFEESSRFRALGLNHESVKFVWEKFCKSPDKVGWSRPWTLYVLAKWCEMNGISDGS